MGERAPSYREIETVCEVFKKPCLGCVCTSFVPRIRRCQYFNIDIEMTAKYIGKMKDTVEECMCIHCQSLRRHSVVSNK